MSGEGEEGEEGKLPSVDHGRRTDRGRDKNSSHRRCNYSNTEYSESERKEMYSFKSDFAEEDIEKCLDEILKNTNITSTQMILRDQLRVSSAEYLYAI